MTPIEAYIAACPPQKQPKLLALRQLILGSLPGLSEKIAWNMPTFHQKKNIIHFAQHKAHIGIYPGAAAIVHFADRLQGFTFSKGAFQIPDDSPLPEQLLRDMVIWCAQQAAS